ncbi:hypothetical protein DPMN_142607 [Dreissena polymorpha]|uniref:Uncharacterized protein n=1 Tax=Dreissena polymorpha TaxID=45954 RepID=A0A9D4GBZ3_DREPO|nr:hypothetical protein DPMN_142607 [Dreissena polymorpha]
MHVGLELDVKRIHQLDNDRHTRRKVGQFLPTVISSCVCTRCRRDCYSRVGLHSHYKRSKSKIHTQGV